MTSQSVGRRVMSAALWCFVCAVSIVALPTAAALAAAPNSPTNVTGVPGNGQVTLSWTAPSGNGSAITKYNILPVKSGVDQTALRMDTPTAATTYVFQGLTNGASYEFFVYAFNGVYGQGSAPSAAVTPRTVPDVPTNVTAVAGPNSATISWTAPSDNGGAAITGYRVTPFINTVAQTPVLTGTTATTFTVTGLTNGTAYEFEVAAVNSAGTSPNSAHSDFITPHVITVPGAPTGVTGQAANNSVVLSWTAPANDGGSAITGYAVTPFINAVAQAAVPTASASTTFTVPGLTNGTAYEFEVAAVNAAGTGANSTHSDFITPAAVPDAPTGITTTKNRGTSSVNVQFTIPSGNGSPITSVTLTSLNADGKEKKMVTTTGTYAQGQVVTVVFTGVRSGKHDVAVSATNAVGTGPSGHKFDVESDVEPAVDSVDPGRVADTRSDGTTVDGQSQATGLRAAGSVTPITVAGRAGVATDATAVALNVTVTDAQNPGYLTVYPCGGQPPTASNVNYTSGSTIPNLVVSQIGTNGQVCVFTQSAVQLVADVNGYFTAGSGLVAVFPARLLETRDGMTTADGQSQGLGRVAAGSITEFQVAGRATVPADAAAAVLNVTATNEAAPGYVTVYPCGEPAPNASNLNFLAGQTIANGAVSKIGALGKVCLYSQVAADLVVDIDGYYPATSPLSPLPPARLMDTRTGFTTVDGQSQAIGQRAAGSVTELTVIGRGGVPATASAVALNVTVTGTAGPGYLTVYPCGITPPTASNVNYTAGQTIPNSVLARIGDNGAVCIFTQTAADIIVDVNAAFS